jgi:hypothetical protein
LFTYMSIGAYRWSDFWMIGLFAGSSHLSFLK